MFGYRKIVQIAASSDTADTIGYIIALCDDGTMWKIYIDETINGEWKLIKPIPQDDVEGGK